jgi:hypothetical protein
MPHEKEQQEQQKEQEQQPMRMIHHWFQTKPKLDCFGAVKSNN